MKNELFHYLTSRGIFKSNVPLGTCSEATEIKREERRRGRLLWIAKGFTTDPLTKTTKIFGRGTYVRAMHGNLK